MPTKMISFSGITKKLKELSKIANQTNYGHFDTINTPRLIIDKNLNRRIIIKKLKELSKMANEK